MDDPRKIPDLSVKLDRLQFYSDFNPHLGLSGGGFCDAEASAGNL
jgi:hypothetical protein